MQSGRTSSRRTQKRHEADKSLVGFVVGDVSYAVPIHAVREIVNPLIIVPLPHAPEAVPGVCDYRGDVVPVVDMRIRLGLADVRITRKTKWIIIDVGGRHVALVVDSVTEVFGTSNVALKNAPPLGGGELERGIASVANHESKMVFVLDVSSLKAVTDPIQLANKSGTAP